MNAHVSIPDEAAEALARDCWRIKALARDLALEVSKRPEDADFNDLGDAAGTLMDLVYRFGPRQTMERV